MHLPMQEMPEMRVQSLSWKDTLEDEMATHSNILAWKILWTEEPGMNSCRLSGKPFVWGFVASESGQGPEKEERRKMLPVQHVIV